MSAKEAVLTLLQAIKADTLECQALQALLVRQEKLLSQADAKALAAINTEVMASLARLGEHARERSALLQGLGVDPNEQGMAKLIAKLPTHMADKAAPLWQQLGSQLAHCKTLNERNGHILASQRELLGELSGQGLVDYGHGR